MLALRIKFIAGRYHATPWNKQVNEGAVDWPPSPWRFLRTLIAIWYQNEQERITREELAALLDKLSALPHYLLPPATIAHTRHFMPIGEIKNDKESTALILDTFAAVSESAPLVMFWDERVELSTREMRVLELLLGGIRYFGRSESWAEAGIFEPTEFGRIVSDDSYSRAYPTEEIPEDGKHEFVKLLACMNGEKYAAWKTKKADAFGGAKLPENTFEALQVQTNDMKNAGWDKPPGSEWVRYARKKDALNILPEPAHRTVGKRPTIARFAVASAVRPNLKHALSLAERVHKSLVKWSDGEKVFSGCDDEGKPLENHQHAYVLCESSGEQPSLRKTVTHITVYAPEGFNEKAENTLRGIKKVWGYGGHDVQLLLLGIGNEEAFADVSFFKKSLRWKSLTPFVPTRHLKSTRAGKPKLDAENSLQIGSPKHDLLRLLGLNGLVPVSVKCEPLGTSNRALLSFTVGRRSGGGRRCGNTGYSCLLEFSELVGGPIAVGYGSHFSLGLFVPADDG